MPPPASRLAPLPACYPHPSCHAPCHSLNGNVSVVWHVPWPFALDLEPPASGVTHAACLPSLPPSPPPACLCRRAINEAGADSDSVGCLVSSASLAALLICKTLMQERLLGAALPPPGLHLLPLLHRRRQHRLYQQRVQAVQVLARHPRLCHSAHPAIDDLPCTAPHHTPLHRRAGAQDGHTLPGGRWHGAAGGPAAHLVHPPPGAPALPLYIAPHLDRFSGRFVGEWVAGWLGG